jgi:hypothetical protein
MKRTSLPLPAKMKRREFITLLGGAVAWPLVARAQEPARPVIGILSNPSRNVLPAAFASFHRGLKDTGYAAAFAMATSTSTLRLTRSVASACNRST